MPIRCYVIEHPAGVVVVDAGADPAYADGASWAGHQGGRRFLQSFLRLQVSEEEVLPVQMREVGLQSAAVDAVVLTHQHIDHAGTVPAFTTAELWTTRAEDAAARILGAEQWRWLPTGRRVRHVDVEGASGELGPAVDLFGDASLRLIHTPGHTPGSITVVLATDQTTLWFTGDTSFTAEAMDPAAPTAGIHTDMRAVRRLQARLKGGGALFPSHDPEASTRLTSLSVSRTDEPA